MNQRRLVIASATLALVVMGLPSQAQPPVPALEQPAVVDPLLASPIRFEPVDGVSGAASFKATAGKDEVTGEVRWGKVSDKAFTSTRLTFTGPLSKGGPTTTLGNLDGLTGKNRASLGFSRVDLPDGLMGTDPKKYCQDVTGTGAPPKPPRCAGLCAGSDTEDAKTGCEQFCAGAAKNSCGNVNGEDDLPLALQIDYGRRVLGSFMVWGVEGSVSAREKFEFTTADTLVESKQEDTSYSASFGIGWATPGRPLLDSWGLRYRYEKGYKPSKIKREVCRPQGDAGVTVCGETLIGGPKEEISHVLSLETRLFPTTGMGVFPSVNYDFEKQRFGVEAPVMFLRGEGGALTGGVVVGWVSEREDAEDEFTATAVIGITSELFRSFQ